VAGCDTSVQIPDSRFQTTTVPLIFIKAINNRVTISDSRIGTFIDSIFMKKFLIETKELTATRKLF
jgi:hypothetical protein